MPSEPDKSKWWWARFSLRALLSVVVIIASFCAGWSVHSRLFRRALDNTRRIQAESRAFRETQFVFERRSFWPEGEGPTRSIALAYFVDGVVTANWGQSVDVALGSDGGLRMGYSLMVLRNDEPVACIVVIDVSPDDCSTRVLMARSKIKVGDRFRAFVDPILHPPATP